MKTKMGKYLCEFDPDNPRATKEGYVYTHILVAEEKLGRLLGPEEVVHHVDEDKYNNDPNNLIVFKTKADHSAFYKGCKAVQDGDVWWCPDKYRGLICPICGEMKGDYKAAMCKRCSDEKQTVFKITRDELKDKIRNSNFLRIGREYGVSDNTIRKRCKQYGLPFKSSVIRSISDEEWLSI